MHGKKAFWGRVKQESRPKFGQVFPVEHPPPPRRSFIPSYEKDPCSPPMGWLLGWEYGRIWLCERDEFLKTTRVKSKKKFVKPDFSSWLMKHAAKQETTSLFQKRKELREQQKRLLAEKQAANRESRQLMAKKNMKPLIKQLPKTNAKHGKDSSLDGIGKLNPQLQQAIIDKPSNFSGSSSKNSLNANINKRQKGGSDLYYTKDKRITQDKVNSSTSEKRRHESCICYCGCCRKDFNTKYD